MVESPGQTDRPSTPTLSNQPLQEEVQSGITATGASPPKDGSSKDLAEPRPSEETSRPVIPQPAANLSPGISEPLPRELSSREKKMASLHETITTLQSTLSTLEFKRDTLLQPQPQTKPPVSPQEATPADREAKTLPMTIDDASQTVKRHIRLLHTYNETRDLATGLLGLVAESRGIRNVDVFDEFGVSEGGVS